MNPSSTLSEEEILQKVVDKVNAVFEEEKRNGNNTFINCHLGIGKESRRKLLVVDTTEGRGFFWIDIVGPDVILSTPTRALKSDLKKFL